MIGLAGFAFVFMKAFKGEDVPQTVSLRPFEGLTQPAAASLSTAELSTEKPDQLVELKAICEVAEVKIIKLEQMLDEKNRMITDLQNGLRSGHDHELQVEDLKQILQAEIEELKSQNKQLKAEIVRLSDENLDLQTKAYAVQVSRASASEHIEVRAEASTSSLDNAPESVHEKEKSVAPKVDAQGGSLSLHDVFGSEEGKTS